MLDRKWDVAGAEECFRSTVVDIARFPSAEVPRYSHSSDCHQSLVWRWQGYFPDALEREWWSHRTSPTIQTRQEWRGYFQTMNQNHGPYSIIVDVSRGIVVHVRSIGAQTEIVLSAEWHFHMDRARSLCRFRWCARTKLRVDAVLSISLALTSTCSAVFVWRRLSRLWFCLHLLPSCLIRSICQRPKREWIASLTKRKVTYIANDGIVGFNVSRFQSTAGHLSDIRSIVEVAKEVFIRLNLLNIFK